MEKESLESRYGKMESYELFQLLGEGGLSEAAEDILVRELLSRKGKCAQEEHSIDDYYFSEGDVSVNDNGVLVKGELTRWERIVSLQEKRVRNITYAFSGIVVIVLINELQSSNWVESGAVLDSVIILANICSLIAIACGFIGRRGLIAILSDGSRLKIPLKAERNRINLIQALDVVKAEALNKGLADRLEKGQGNTAPVGGVSYHDLLDLRNMLVFQEGGDLDDKQVFETYVSIGTRNYLNKNYRQAIEYYEAALSINDRSIDTWCSLGDLYEDLGWFEKAIGCYNKVASLSGEAFQLMADEIKTGRRLKEYQGTVELNGIKIK